MICIKCGHSNPGGLNFCQRCNAHLVKMGPVGGVASAIDIEEGKSYLTPQRSYPTEYMYNLTCRAYEYVQEGASGDPLLEAYEVVRSSIEAFECDGLPAMMASFEEEKLDLPEDDYSRQMIYLMNRGVSLFHEGFDFMDRFIQSGENPTLVEAIARMQEANDYLGLARELATLRSQKVDDELAQIAAARRLAEQQVTTGAGVSPKLARAHMQAETGGNDQAPVG